MKLRSLQLKIAGLAGLCLLGTAIAMVGFATLSNRSSEAFVQARVGDLLERGTRTSLQALARAQAGLIRSELDSAFGAARNMARAFEQIAADDAAVATPPALRRAQLDGILLSVLKAHPRFNGTYSAWEPNGLDSLDAEAVAGHRAGTDASGRFLSYWTRDSSGHIAVQPLVEYDSRERHPNGVIKGAWYLGPQANGQESILGPLPYIVQGKSVYLATMSVPVSIGGRFHGVAGADFDLAFVQKLAEQVKALREETPNPSLPVRLAAARVAHAWLATHTLETMSCRHQPGTQQALLVERQLASAERRLAVALRSLAALRRLTRGTAADAARDAMQLAFLKKIGKAPPVAAAGDSDGIR